MPLTGTNRNLLIFGSGMQVILLLQQAVGVFRGSPINWSLSGVMFGCLLLTASQLLAESSHRAHWLLICAGLALIVTCAVASVWTDMHRSSGTHSLLERASSGLGAALSAAESPCEAPRRAARFAYVRAQGKHSLATHAG
jgi:uncharacterized membrane protein (UPF0136 family)